MNENNNNNGNNKNNSNNINNINNNSNSNNIFDEDIVHKFTTTFSQISNNISKRLNEMTQNSNVRRTNTIRPTRPTRLTGINIDPNNYQNFGDIEEFEQHDFLLNNSMEPFVAKLFAFAKYNTALLPTCLDDTVEIPQAESKKFLMQENSIVDISFEGNHVYAKVVGYSAENRMIVMPQWMINKIKAKQNDFLKIELANIKKITMVKVIAPSNITNSLGVLEFHLRNRNILYSGEQITVKMFEKTYIFTISEIYSGEEKLETGLLYGNSLTTEIKFDLVII